MNRIAFFVMMCGWATLSSPDSLASGSMVSVTNPGALGLTSADATGSRQRVRLTPAGRLLVGRPVHSDIALIAVDAPGSGTDHVMLREVARSEQELTVLISGPARLVSRTRRATLFIRNLPADWMLHEFAEGVWEPRKGERVITSAGSEDGKASEVTAFLVQGLGFYALRAERPVGAGLSQLPAHPSAGWVLSGGLLNGIAPLWWALVALLICRALSRWAFVIDRREEG